MSITRLRQARQMYAMGQRVGRIAFGGGGSYVSGDGAGKYQGGSGAPGSAESKGMGGQGSTYSSPSDHNETYGNTNPATDPGGYVSDKNPTGTLTGKNYQEAEEEYQNIVGKGYLQNLYDNPQQFKGIFGIPTPFSIGANLLSPFIHKMKQAAPHKKLIPAPANEDNTCACSECPYMKLNTLEKIHASLVHLQPEIFVPEETRLKALKSVNRMLELS